MPKIEFFVYKSENDDDYWVDESQDYFIDLCPGGRHFFVEAHFNDENGLDLFSTKITELEMPEFPLEDEE